MLPDSVGNADVFEGPPTPRGLLALKFSAAGFFAGAILWSVRAELLGQTARTSRLWLAPLPIGVMVALFVVRPLWVDRRYACRVTTSPHGLDVVTARAERFAVPWHDVTELSRYDLFLTKWDSERCLRLRSRLVPYLFLTESLHGFDDLVRRIEAATPQARHDAPPTWLDSVMGGRRRRGRSWV